MSVTAIVRPSLERRRAVLRCRFTIGSAPCHDLRLPFVKVQPPCHHLEKAMYEAGGRFIHDMARQGWEFLDRMALAGGPYPVTPIANSVPKAPPRKKGRLGPRSTAPDIYPSGVLFDLPKLDFTDAWDYELAGAFVRLLPPTEILDTDAPAIEARAAQRRSQRGRS